MTSNNLFTNWLATREPKEEPKEEEPKEIAIESDWIRLKNYPRYEISLTIPHVIRKVETNKIISQSINNVGYYQISLDGKTMLLHRIIAEQFLENPNNFQDVNHKNHNKLDNRIINLEWISHSDNLSKRKTFTKKVSEYVYEIDDKCIPIKSLDGKPLNRYYYDKTNDRILLRSKNETKFKIVKPSSNGNIDTISLSTADGSMKTKSYEKVMKYLRASF